jgi:hypothetical protein
MFLVFAVLAGFLVALLIHWFTWMVRLSYPTLTVIAGGLSAIGLIGFGLLFLNSDIVNMMMIVLVNFWAAALLLGGLQAFALKIAGWRGVAGVFLEMGLAVLTGAAVNLTLQKYIEWLDQQFPGLDVYAVINTFLWTMIITLLVLAVIRLLILLNTARSMRSG